MRKRGRVCNRPANPLRLNGLCGPSARGRDERDWLLRFSGDLLADFGESFRAAGISNYGSRIGIFFNSSKDLTSERFQANFETFLHEFGHAFGLRHQLDSHIMYSAEVDPDKIGDPNPTFYRWFLDSGSIWPEPDFSLDEVMDGILERYNGTQFDFEPLGTAEWVNLTKIVYNNDTTPPITGYVNQSYILCLEDSGLITVLWISSSIENTPEGYRWHKWAVRGCEVTVEGVGI